MIVIDDCKERNLCQNLKLQMRKLTEKTQSEAAQL